MQPSTAWKEVIAADEAAVFEAYAPKFAAIQKRRSERFGAGRTLHRKAIALAEGRLEVQAKLPEFCRHGLFAQPGVHEAWVRLSNGGMDRAPDQVPDIRGFAFKVFDVAGPSALGQPQAVSQDFLLINQPRFSFAQAPEFMDFVLAAARGNGALLQYLVRRYGLFGGPARLARLLKTVARPFGGFACEPLFSAVPIACGPYAVRYRLQPHAGNGAPDRAARQDWGADFARRLRAGSLAWDLQLQAFTDEATTPIEDASVDWPTPYTTVATLHLPQQDLDSPAAQALATRAEAGVFDPWQALAVHRPLGNVQRARKVIYFDSQKGRNAA